MRAHTEEAQKNARSGGDAPDPSPPYAEETPKTHLLGKVQGPGPWSYDFVPDWPAPRWEAAPRWEGLPGGPMEQRMEEMSRRIEELRKSLDQMREQRPRRKDPPKPESKKAPRRND